MNTRLSILFFLQFAVWGCYLVSMGQYLGASGLGPHIQWFYAVGGFVALVVPALAGAVADRYVGPQRMLGWCHLAGAAFMLATFGYGYHSEGAPEFATLFTLFTLSTIFYIPTLALCNSASMALLRSRGIAPATAFPRIRVWGTIGFIAALWAVNSVWVVPGEGIGLTLSDDSPHAMQRMQYTVMQLLAAGVMEAVLAGYAFTLPVTAPTAPAVTHTTTPVIGSLKLLADRRLLPYFIFAMFIGVALQINNGYVAPYLTHFRAMPEFATSFGANNATLLTSLSQISEAVWILPVGAVLAGIGIKRTIVISIFAWVVNFGCFALGDTGSGLWLIITAMLVYGVAFDFFNVASALFIDQQAPEGSRSAAQGLQMMMTKGVGSSAGMLCAGAVVNHFCHWEGIGGSRYLMGDWATVWLIFTAYCALIGIAFILLFKQPAKAGR